MNTCDTCKHWTEYRPKIGMDGVRYCAVITESYNWAPPPENGANLTRYEDEQLVTGPKFGCVLWEKP
jgi:hypothetical protein